MKSFKTILFTTLFVTVAGAHADGGGSFTIRNQEFALKSAYAYSCPDPFDQDKQSTVIAFSGRAFDALEVSTADDPASALSAALDSYLPDKERRPSKVEIMITREKSDAPIQNISYSIPNETSGASVGAARYTLDLRRNDDSRIEGTLRSRDPADKNSPFGGYFDLHFALDVHPDSGC